MPSTHTKLLYHLIFSTKNREPVLSPDLRPNLHKYLGGITRKLDGIPLGVGGYHDHVHLLVGLKPTHGISDFMRELKKSSSIWITETTAIPNFHWQDGYAAITVSASAKDDVLTYIANQAEHHRHKTFREELTEFLDRTGIEYDPEYLD